MDMAELIEAIDKIDKPLLVHITKETYELVQEPGNNRLVRNDFCDGFHDKEDAIVYLFDVDIFGWSIKSFNWCNPSCGNRVPWWELEVNLFKTN